MVRYIALLRGINVGGNNKIAIQELKAGFEALGFEQVVTHLNSGNVIFSANDEKDYELTEAIERMIQSKFALEIPVLIIPQEEVVELLREAPTWWGSEDKEIYDNLIFLYPDLSFGEFLQEVGAPNETYEKVQQGKQAVFWSFVRQEKQKTNWWTKTATARIRQKTTIHTANTVRKIAEL